jgi:predicted phage terminase large subunit-like protein
MKSILVSVLWPTWVWTHLPSKRIVAASASTDLVIRDAVKSRRVIQSKWYQERFGDVFQLTGDQNVKSRYENDKTGFRFSVSVGGAVTGEGGDILAVDDPMKAQDAYSANQRQTVNDWWDQTMSTRGNDPKKVAKLIIMQRLHTDDLTGHVLEKMKEDGAEQFEHLCLPMEYEPKRFVSSIGLQDPRSQAGALLWPERFGPKEVAALKTSLGSMGAAGQLQQRPAPGEGGIFQRTWWRFWQPRDSDLPAVQVRLPDGSIHTPKTVKLPEGFSGALQSWDMSFNENDDSAYVVGQVWGRRGALRFLLAQERKRMPFPETVRAVEDLAKRYPTARPILIENKANGPAVIQTLRAKIGGIVAINPHESKTARAQAVSPTVEAGNVHLPHPALAPWVWDFIEELANFPAGYADQVDTMSQALSRMALDDEREKASGQTQTTSKRTW